MNFDFETLLTLATLVAGLIWLVDAVFFAGKRRLRSSATDATGAGKLESKRREPIVVEYSKSLDRKSVV